MAGIGQSNFLQALGWAVLNSLWQMALLWVVYQLFVAVFRFNRPSQKTTLATGLLIGGFAWFAYTLCSILLTESTSEYIASSGIIQINGNSQLNSWLGTTLPIASLIYLLLLVFPFLHFIRNYRYVKVIRRYGLSKANVEWKMFVSKVATQMGIKKKVHVWISELVTSPVTIGYIKPIILLPMAAVNNLSTVQLEAILLHELAHIRRFDYFINLVIRCIQTVLYFNPFVKSFIQIIEREREKSCDDIVMQYQYDPHGYASALLVLEKSNYLQQQLVVAAAGKKTDLLNRIEWIMGVEKKQAFSFNRIEWIMGVEKKQAFSFNRIAGVFAGLLCIITLNALLILSKPSSTTASSTPESFASLGSPLYFFTHEPAEKVAQQVDNIVSQAETVAEPIINNIIASAQSPITTEPAKPITDHLNTEHKMIATHPEERLESLMQPYIHAAASIEIPQMPVLKEYQEQQVKEAIDASKKIIDESQWQAVEKSFGEIFTEQQKADLKTAYMKAMSSVDMTKWEERLRSAYDRVNWDRVSGELNKAIVNIRLDSLNKVYSLALSNLNTAQKELKEGDLNSIPDTDVTLQRIEQQKGQVQKALNRLNLIKTKKIVKL